METFHLDMSSEHHFQVLKMENKKLTFTKSWISPKIKEVLLFFFFFPIKFF